MIKSGMDIFILAGARTPFAAWAGGATGAGVKGGALKPLDPFDLGAAALKAAVAKSGLGAERLDKVVFGNMYAVGPHACYGARYVSHRAGLPESVPGLNVSMACGTGLYAVIAAAQDITLGSSQVVASVGADNVSLVRRDVFVPSFNDISCGLHIAKTAETLAKEYGFSRADQDRWALRSHEAALRAQKRGLFDEEITPTGAVAQDDAVLQNPTADFFAKSEPLFDEPGSAATAANTHAVVDGGSALILASRPATAQPLGRYVSGAVIGLAPARMALGSVLAIRKALELAKLKISDIDLFEINETFAAQMLIDIKELGIPEDKVNVNGGALALGHPFAATGARLVLTLLKELERRGLKRGAASICVGGGLGVAVIVER